MCSRHEVVFLINRTILFTVGGVGSCRYFCVETSEGRCLKRTGQIQNFGNFERTYLFNGHLPPPPPPPTKCFHINSTKSCKTLNKLLRIKNWAKKMSTRRLFSPGLGMVSHSKRLRAVLFTYLYISCYS